MVFAFVALPACYLLGLISGRTCMAGQSLAPKYLLVTPSFWQLPDSPEKEALQYKIAAWQQAGYQVKSLQPGFPEADSNALASQHRNYWALAAAFAGQAAQDSVLLLSDAQARHFQGEAPALPAHWQWHYFADERQHYSLDQIYRFGKDSLVLWLSESSEKGHQRHFLHTALPAVGASVAFQKPNVRLWRASTVGFYLNKAIQDTVFLSENHSAVAILYESGSPHDTLFLAKALGAVAAFHKKNLQISYLDKQEQDTEAKLLFYLSSQKLSQALCERFTFIVLADSAQLAPFEEYTCGSARVYGMKNPIEANQEEVLNSRFLNLLAALVATPPSKLPAMQQLSASQRAYPAQAYSLAASEESKALKTIFWYLSLLLLIAERIISYLYSK